MTNHHTLQLSPTKSVAIVSDSHLTIKFSQNLLDAYMKLLNEHDYLIINGDFVEGVLCTFQDIVNSPWIELLEALQKHECYYLVGNHDPIDIAKPFQQYFTWIGESMTIETPKQKYHIEHGHHYIDFHEKQLEKIVRTRIYHQLIRLNIFKNKFRNGLPQGIQPYFFRKRDNLYIEKSWAQKNHDAFLVTGHTHRSYLNYQKKYANSGTFLAGKSKKYLIVNKDGITLESAE